MLLTRIILWVWGAFLASACSPSDFCLSSGKKLSDSELISRAVGDGKTYPNCCRVNRGETKEIEAYLKVEPSDETQKKYPSLTYYETHFEINSCGDVLRRYGMHVTADQRPCWVRGEKISSVSDLELIQKALAVASEQLGQKSTPDSIKSFLSKRPDCCLVQRNVSDETGHVYAAQVIIIPDVQSNTTSSKRLLVSFNPCADWAHTSLPQEWASNKTPWASE